MNQAVTRLLEKWITGLEQAAIGEQFLEDGHGRFHVAIHHALAAVLLEHRAADRGSPLI